MSACRWWFAAVCVAGSVTCSAASARALTVDVRTDRGQDGVYRIGDPLEIEARASDDAYLLVYEIDAEGYVHLLFPSARRSSQIEGGRTYSLPERDSDLELVARGPVGEGYIVAIAAYDPFRELPWYLRPYDPRAEEMGYEGAPDEDSGVTAEGRIVGDPFVAMERIRRKVLEDPDDQRSFATTYINYYVGHQVRYPRYLCYDCHRPGYWAWWSGFDPYYANCSVFDFRVNWRWSWGPSCWTGRVPYYVFVYRSDCPPRYRVYGSRHVWHSSWDGWSRWRELWGGPLRRYKSDPAPTTKYDPARRWPKNDPPPGYLTGLGRRLRGGVQRDPVVRDPGLDRLGGRGERGRDGRDQVFDFRHRLRAPRAWRVPSKRDGGRGETRRGGDGDRGRANEMPVWRGDRGRDGDRGRANEMPVRRDDRERRDPRHERGTDPGRREAPREMRWSEPRPAPEVPPGVGTPEPSSWGRRFTAPAPAPPSAPPREARGADPSPRFQRPGPAGWQRVERKRRE